MEINAYRELFNGIETPVQLKNGNEVIPINFDNAATTPPFKKVDEFIYENISMYGSVGRGGHKSQYCTEAYEISREEILQFFGINKQDEYEVIYVKNTTEGINLLAHILGNEKNYKVLTTRMEHHANDLPWREHAHPYYCEVDEKGQINFEEFEECLKRAQGTIRYVSVAGAGNVLGYTVSLHQLAKIVHAYHAYLIIDAAQLVAHKEVNLMGDSEEEAIDFMIFSGHKMYAPFGSGVIVGRKKLLENKVPFLSGGGSVTFVLDDDVYYKPSPYRDEAGTPNFLGAMAIVAAMAVLKGVGYKAIEEHEQKLKMRLLAGLSEVPRVILYGDSLAKNRLGVAAFNIEGIHHDKVGQLLQDIRGIAVRTGCFCAQPYVMRLLGISNKERYSYLQNPNLKKPGMIRASLGLYNTEEEVDIFLEVVNEIARKY